MSPKTNYISTKEKMFGFRLPQILYPLLQRILYCKANISSSSHHLYVGTKELRRVRTKEVKHPRVLSEQLLETSRQLER